MRHHLDVFTSAQNYDRVVAGVDADLAAPMGPIAPVLARIDPIPGSNSSVINAMTRVRAASTESHAKAPRKC